MNNDIFHGLALPSLPTVITRSSEPDATRLLEGLLAFLIEDWKGKQRLAPHQVFIIGCVSGGVALSLLGVGMKVLAG